MIPELVHTFDISIQFIEQSVGDLSEEQMVAQPAGVPNHPTWTLGHIIFSCQGLATEIGAEPWLPDEWESTYGFGSTPFPDLTRYPKKSEMLALLTDAASRLRQTLLAENDSFFCRSLPDETFPTMGHLLLQVVVAHTAFHAGQLAVWRRAMGLKSVAVFV